MSGDILEYCAKIRGQRCKKDTHKPRIEKLVIDHIGLSMDTHFVKLLTEEDEKEIDDIYYKGYITRKSEYYMDNSTLNAIVQSYDEQKKYFFQSCEELLSNTKQLYQSLLLEIEEKKDDEKTWKDYVREEVKKELETSLWQLSYSLGIPIMIDGCDPQVNCVKKLSRDPSATIIYYTRLIDSAKKRTQEDYLT
jgi:hypothetical protein